MDIIDKIICTLGLAAIYATAIIACNLLVVSACSLWFLYGVILGTAGAILPVIWMN